MSSDVKQVKVANWGTYFLQRLKHFFNRTDYCDLTLQFQDNAQLKVHRLVLSACTEYFELLERTCEMYEDCLVMPDDLQADVVVPIVNFMYTGQLEFKMELLERLYQTSQVLNLPVLTKLLKSHREDTPKKVHQSYSSIKKYSTKNIEPRKVEKTPTHTSTSINMKRSYGKAFANETPQKSKKAYPTNKSDSISNNHSYIPSPPASETSLPSKKAVLADPRPSRYELPEELDQDNIFDNSFCNISYASAPLMVHPETVKRYSSKKNKLYDNGSLSKKFPSGVSTLDIVECKKITKEDSIYDDGDIEQSLNDETGMFPASFTHIKDETKDSSQLFDQILEQPEGPKVTIETSDNKLSPNIDHAKIISKVLKKYPHLVKSSKNIKLKILNTQTNTKPNKKQVKPTADNTTIYTPAKNKQIKVKSEEPDFTYETDVLDSKEAAKLIALGAENIKGPWICLICGTPGKAIHFTSYYKFRRHLVDVHHEKPVSNICEYCGLKSLKRNYLLHHLYSQHGIQPPPQYNFPKCNKCNYIALTEAFLVKHKMSHHLVRSFRCNVCAATFNSSNNLLIHIQSTGHKYSGDRKTNIQCIYCLKMFLREPNLFTHLKTNHKKEAKRDGIIEESDDDEQMKVEREPARIDTRFEPSTSYDNDYEVDLQFQIHQKPDGEIQVVSQKHQNMAPKQKILNAGFGGTKPLQNIQTIRNQPERSDYLEDISVPSSSFEEIVVIDNTEYVMRDHQLIPREKPNNEFVLSEMIDNEPMHAVQPTTSMNFAHQPANIEENVQQPSMIIKKAANMGQPIQIVVSNEEEYKALIASNHPIIFDNTDSSKTLTMLTAQHETSLEPTTIDLHKTQSNDMMILPEYPLNATEAVTADNQNIVVVYSHDQNKQYQIISTQGLGPQFVQSSAVITQNYETVTTATPIMSAHVLDSHVEESWQNNVQAMETQQVAIPQQAELHSIVQTEHLEIAPAQNIASNTVHEENLIANQSELVPSAVMEDTNKIAENIVSIDSAISSDVIPIITEPQQLELHEPTAILETVAPQDLNTSAMETDDCNTETLVENIPSSSAGVTVESNTIEDAIPQMDVSNENPVLIETPTAADIGVMETSLEDTIQPENIIDNPMEMQNTDIPEDVSMETKSIESTIIHEVHPVVPESPTYTEMVDISPVPNEETTPNKEAEVKIQSLTSEWSEDEYDVPEDNQPVEVLSKPVDEPTLEAKSPETETEETIENIQQEVEKHMGIETRHVETAENIAPSDITPLEATLMSSEEPQVVENAKDIVTVEQTDPKEKISSLLNDWEDNDSQEEGASQEEATPVIDSEAATTSIELIQPEQDGVTETEEPKNESIKKLVSDWDEDDEDDKD